MIEQIVEHQGKIDALRLSVSKAKTFIDCRAKYKFSYILKLPKKDHSYFTFGSFCHRVLEFFHAQYIEGCLLPYHITMQDAFKVAWEEYKVKMTPEMKKEAWDIINEYLKQITIEKQNGKPFNIIAVEKKFDFPMTESLTLNGFIDVIQLDADNVIHVKDYKTTKNKKYLKDDFFQLLTYAYYILNFEEPLAQTIRGSYILLRHNFEHITVEFSRDEIMAVKDKYIAYANSIVQEKEFAPNPNFLCNYCDFVSSCSEGSKQVGTFSGEVSW